ncbi:MAG TPA: sporulation protein YqfD [Firmicutes bacterium]|nr:sporulation protein YqfD [Bacillota bacterium]
MIRQRLTALVTGAVRITASGPALERFVNQLVVSGILLMDVEVSGGSMTALLLLEDFRRLRPAARATRTRVRIIGKSGLAFTIRRLGKRRAILLGAAVLAAILLYLNSRIWVIEIRGNEKIPVTTISEVLEKAGVRPGMRKSSMNLRDVEGIILQSVKELSWVSVRVEGGKAVVEVVEKSMLPDKPQGPCDIVARKPGVITEIIVFSGTALVKEGQTVTQGQVLISGEVSFTETDPAGKQVIVKRAGTADGIVKARVWYQSYNELPLEYLKPIVTGQRVTKYTLRLGSKEIELMSIGAKTEGPRYVEVKRLAPAQWRNIILPVEVTKTVYNQVRYDVVSASVEEVEMKAMQEAKAALLESIPPDVEVVDSRIHVRRGEDFVGVLATVETLENIGEARSVSGGKTEY